MLNIIASFDATNINSNSLAKIIHSHCVSLLLVRNTKQGLCGGVNPGELG